MLSFRALTLRLKVARTLGPAQVGWYALYQLGLRSGHYRRATPTRHETAALRLEPPWRLPAREELVALVRESAREELLSEVEEILQGKARLFGGPAVPIQLEPPAPPVHWSEYELGRVAWGMEDVKFAWEPARFGWAFTLGRAYTLAGDEGCPQAFWNAFEVFDRANPPNLGPNWASAQEVALRLVAFLFAGCSLAASPHSTPARLARLAQSVAEHAARIPPTLPYALAQHNNHLVSEGLGLYAAGAALPHHPQSARWREQGWRELNRALQSQIAPDGAYCQHSTNYHRLMLQAALLADAIRRAEGRAWPAESLERLSNATRWLYNHLDLSSGRVPNLGHNDGAHILPLAAGGFSDHRPTLQAAARAFEPRLALEPGAWDELSAWLGLTESWAAPDRPTGRFEAAPLRLTTPDGRGWASLRAARFTSRPAHADQLHVEIWHASENLALDAGTYRYNAPPPWENALATAQVHNTVCVDGRDQMTRAGKFLWVDWTQARLLECGAERIRGEHEGYLSLGVLHRRELGREPTGWRVTDDLLPAPGEVASGHEFTLHWLLPDWPFTLERPATLRLAGPSLAFRIHLQAQPGTSVSSVPAGEHGTLQVIRAGEGLLGPPPPGPLFGWQSPAYNLRLPALALRLTAHAAPPLRFVTRFEIL